jgi:hypothetical protein
LFWLLAHSRWPMAKTSWQISAFRGMFIGYSFRIRVWLNAHG